MAIELSPDPRTQRLTGRFLDCNETRCMIVDASFGPAEPAVGLGFQYASMRLSPAMVAELIPLLEHFVRTGRLAPEPEGDTAHA